MKNPIWILVIITLKKSNSYFINLYYSLINFIDSTVEKIPLKQKSTNLCKNVEISKNGNITNEFSFLMNYIDFDQGHYMYLNKGNEIKDRYGDIKSYNHNLITINGGRGYINASPINIINNKYFITTQGPKEETIDDFWTMIWENNCRAIVMLCNQMEGGRPKCERYWDPKLCKQAKIERLKNDDRKYYVIRKIKLYNNNQERVVYQIHYTAWPDHGVPDIRDKKVFDVFDEIIELIDRPAVKLNGPIVVHCSAGVGRTGTFISMYFLKKEIIKQIENKVSEIKFSVFNLVRKLKEMRLYLVQTESQYRFIYEYVKYLLDKYNV